ncbi:clusterin-associated protein 1 homolog [Limanda limanda]|uniref:clusterin-associated protein 1 homolog n=1 Tax=Limanda limanda TaxID=27771 RepID=UPI0029C933D3|nr:clusterin-associated protein 1 homolog [Limanda limanda]
MSFREIRNFIEQMRALEYPRSISMESFRRPNFYLLADILRFLVKSIEPHMNIPTDVATEASRVTFIRAVVQFMVTKAQVKLNLKHLYQADGYAVREMLKITSQLYDNLEERVTPDDRDTVDDSEFKFDRGSWMSDLKAARQLTSEVTASGASLCGLLGEEVALREKRTAAISRPLDINETEKAFEDALKEVLLSAEKTGELLRIIESDVAILDDKIEQKMKEVEMTQTRLQTCRGIRPVYMDEYEKIEAELEKSHEDYVVKFRCLTHLDALMDQCSKVEKQKLKEAENARKTIQRYSMWGARADEDSDSENSGDEGPGNHREECRLATGDSFIKALLGNKRFHNDDDGGDEDEEEPPRLAVLCEANRSQKLHLGDPDLTSS